MTESVSFKKTFQTLEDAISITQKRHGLIASNISNLNTPGYCAKDIDFRETLENAMNGETGFDLKRTDPKHIGFQRDASLRIEPFEDNDAWNGFNSVDIDKEMTRLTENNLIFRTAVESLLRKISMLNEVIREGGR